jgi:hypothetical protein
VWCSGGRGTPYTWDTGIICHQYAHVFGQFYLAMPLHIDHILSLSVFKIDKCSVHTKDAPIKILLKDGNALNMPQKFMIFLFLCVMPLEVQ